MNPREAMVWKIKKRYGLSSPRVFSAMLQVPREGFVDPKDKNIAYSDAALSIGHGQTISQPYTVAFMSHYLDLKRSDRVLEVGTGSGYQTAILAKLAREVYSVERIVQLSKKAKRVLEKLQFNNVHLKIAKDELGWRQKAPYHAIIVTAGVEGKKPPQELFDQLRLGGRLVAPVGYGKDKAMFKFKKTSKGIEETYLGGPFSFVPLIES